MSIRNLLRPEFRLPIAVFLLLIGGVMVPAYSALWILATMFGLVKVTWDSMQRIRRGSYSLDYIAFLAMTVSLIADQYLAGAVVALMITGGESLEEYASARAESALRSLAERIPKSCTVRYADATTSEVPIQDVKSGSIIVVRQNELIPLDGTLRSSEALINEANLTGEAIPVNLSRGSFIKSGCVNFGETIDIEVEGGFETSTYMRIVRLVDDAKKYQAPVVRLAEKVNFPFTAIALGLAGAALALTGELSRALAVLVIATPCPLIIAAPVAFIGGLSRAARRNIIVKRPAALEQLSHTTVIFFDKTGTLTLGEPVLSHTAVTDKKHTEDSVLAIASAIEFHSIHPLARAMLAARSARKAPLLEATAVTETIGHGIEGVVDGVRYVVSKARASHGDGITLSLSEGDREIARFKFEDEIKENVGVLIRWLKGRDIAAEMLTGDWKENAERLFGHLGIPIHAECTPETKSAAIDAAKKKGATVVMIGDGLNDAPALAHAHVGVVFSGTENSAAIDAAAVVILGKDVGLIRELLETSTRSTRVAAQSIWGGVALSTVGMLFAAFGYIPPISGAFTQEAIDITVILNSLRAARQ